MLHSEGDADYGYAAQASEYQMDNSYLPPPEQNPDEVHYRREAPRLTGTVHQFVTERPEAVSPEFEQLDAKRNTHEGNAHQQAHDEVKYGHKDTAEKQPEYVT
jgi:hypothetical protein